MAKSRPTMRCRINVESLEGRLALSAVGGVAPMHASEVSTLAAKKGATGTLKGSVMKEEGGFYVYNGVSAKLGKAQFSGGGIAQVAGSRVIGGEIHLGNAGGILNLRLGTGRLKSAGHKTMSTQVVFVIDTATGKYASIEGDAGRLNVIIPDSPFKTHFSSSVIIASGSGEGLNQ